MQLSLTDFMVCKQIVPTVTYKPEIILPGIFPMDSISEPVKQIHTLQQQFSPKNITFDINDANKELWLSINNGNIDRDRFLKEYKSLGETVKIEGDRGIPDLNKKRLLNLQQFFTPQPLIKFITKALMLDEPGVPASVMDNSCGIGRMFQYLNPACDVAGIEVEEKACHMVRCLYPKANIIKDSLINYHTVPADYYFINPPFSIQLEKKNCGFHNAGWGGLGPRSSIKSHVAAMETAISSARYYVAAMLPQGYFTNEDTLTFERWVNERAHLILRLDIDAKAFKEYGFNWPCSLMIYDTTFSSEQPIHHKIESIDDATLDNELLSLYQSPHIRKINQVIDEIKRRGPRPINLALEVESQPVEYKHDLPIHGSNKVNLCLSPDASSLNIKVDNLLSALKLDQFKHGMGESWNDGLKEYTKEADMRLRRRNLLENPSVINDMAQGLSRLNLEVHIDKQLIEWHIKKLKWLNRQQTPFEQWILKDGGSWVCLHENDGIKSMYHELYQSRLKKLDDLGISKWLWPFQREDIARMSLKDTNLMCWSMGLGKTRGIIAMAIMYGVKHSLIVVEPKLKDEFVKEFKNLGIPETDYQVILHERQLKTLRKFNIIAYNLLWRSLNEHTKKTFAKAMRRRFQFIAIDEAHKIKAKDSQQAKAVRMLKARYKLLSTGTPIANYPRNIFSLLVWGWGDATERNKYGYYSAIEKDIYGYTTGTRQFKEDFISIEWVTPQFEQTLDSGAKSREVPKIKDPVMWWQMMSPKILRRQRDEPEVRKVITFPKPVITTELIKMSPDHIRHYRHWLDNFASWFREQLRLEKEGGHKIDQMMVLAHLTQLQFASTIPQSQKTDVKEIPWSFGLTTKQQRAKELVKHAVEHDERVIVFSERPEFQRYMQRVLLEDNIKSHLFVGEQGIKERNILLDDFRHNGTNVLLATTSCGEVGLNIPEANVVIIADTSWTPSRQVQAYSRVLRPQQKKIPRITLLRSKGSIDEYMQQLMDAKSEAIGEGIDYQQASEFDPEKWLSYKDFTIKMLREEGYNI